MAKLISLLCALSASAQSKFDRLCSEALEPFDREEFATALAKAEEATVQTAAIREIREMRFRVWQ